MNHEIIDHSDRLARLQVLVSLLKDWEPDGKWCQTVLFRKWQKFRHSLTVRESDALLHALEKRHRELERQVYAKKYVQPNLFGSVDE